MIEIVNKPEVWPAGCVLRPFYGTVSPSSQFDDTGTPTQVLMAPKKGTNARKLRAKSEAFFVNICDSEHIITRLTETWHN